MDPPTIWTPRVHLMLRAISRSHSPPRQAAPLTYHQLSLMFKSLSGSRDHLIIASSISLHYFACLRASEVCTDLQNSIIPLRSDLSFSLSPRPSMTFRVKSSKTNPHGFIVHLGCSGQPICAVCINHHYLHSYPIPPSAPLYQFSTGQHLTYNIHNSNIKNLLQRAGLDPSQFSSHSLRAGAATQAARAGLSGGDIKRLGRWRSQAYEAYLRPPRGLCIPGPSPCPPHHSPSSPHPSPAPYLFFLIFTLITFLPSSSSSLTPGLWPHHFTLTLTPALGGDAVPRLGWSQSGELFVYLFVLLSSMCRMYVIVCSSRRPINLAPRPYLSEYLWFVFCPDLLVSNSG